MPFMVLHLWLPFLPILQTFKALPIWFDRPQQQLLPAWLVPTPAHLGRS